MSDYKLSASLKEHEDDVCKENMSETDLNRDQH